MNIEHPTSNIESSIKERTAVAALLFATLLWGCGFTWAKAAGEAINQLSGAGEKAPLGPIWVLAARFLIAGVLWLIIFRESRRGWDWPMLWRALVLGGTLTLGMIVQHLGLDRTSEAASAFLTSLTILFVPLIMTIVYRRPPAGIVWMGVALAAVGVWLMTGADFSNFGVGEALGIACAFAYSINIIAINLLVTPRNVLPITGGQFFVVALACAATCLFLPHGLDALRPASIIEFLKHSRVGINVALLGGLVSLVAFGLQFRFQPRLDPTRATLIYLVEPIFAALFAWIAIGRGMTAIEMLGAGLILLANALVEALQSRTRRNMPPAAIID